MRGSMFVDFLALVEQKHGLDTVDQIIARLGEELSTGGAYTSVGNYPHGELLAMATTLSTLKSESMEAIIGEFARHLMGEFRRLHGEYFDQADNAFDFLLSIGEQIHIDVRKLYPDARPPEVTGENRGDDAMYLSYRSHRPLSALALALVNETASVFDESMSVEILSQSDDGTGLELLMRRPS